MPAPRPAAWDHDLPAAEALRFVCTFLDAFLNAKLDEELNAEFSLLCACAYYLGGQCGQCCRHCPDVWTFPSLTSPVAWDG